jgi:beta-glucanase (GH16 family)
MQQEGHTYGFTWEPGVLSWSTTAGGGQSYTYTTAQALATGTQDLVQCMPADVEVRINLWNMNGMAAPTGLSSTDRVEVVIDDFSFTKSNLFEVANGEPCSKHCQCGKGSKCNISVCESVA